MSNSEYIENLERQVWSVSRYDLKTFHYNMDFATRGQIEFMSDHQYAESLSSQLMYMTEKDMKKNRRLIKRLTEQEFSNKNDNTKPGEMARMSKAFGN